MGKGEEATAIKAAVTTTTTDEAVILNRKNDACLEEIERSVKQQPLTSDRVPLTYLDEQYQDAASDNFRLGIAALKQEYQSIRMVRGDGNCYYRAFLYALVEQIMYSNNNNADAVANNSKKKEGERIVGWLKKDSWNQVLEVGYDEMTLEIFYDSIVDLLERILQGKLTLEEFHKEMNEDSGTSDYCTWYMRVITATHLKSDPIRFLPFVDAPGLDIAHYCQREVEPMGKECEMLQALALAEAFGIQVLIEYLDGHELQNGKLSKHVVGADRSVLHLTLLYRPGHYDILYPIE